MSLSNSQFSFLIFEIVLNNVWILNKSGVCLQCAGEILRCQIWKFQFSQIRSFHTFSYSYFLTMFKISKNIFLRNVSRQVQGAGSSVFYPGAVSFGSSIGVGSSMNWSEAYTPGIRAEEHYTSTQVSRSSKENKNVFFLIITLLEKSYLKELD